MVVGYLMAKPILKELKTSELVVDEFNVRGDEWNPKDDDEEKLIDSVKAQGVLEPLLVRPIKGQKSKYRAGKNFSIVCGGRRYKASMEARLKTIPCVIRTDLDDVKTLGTSIQENLKRRSMDKIQTANGIGRMMDMLNGGRSYEQKMAEMKKLFGMKHAQIERYYGIYKLSKEVAPTLLQESKLDTHTLYGIQTSKWDSKQKEKAIEILSGIEKQEEKDIALSEMKKKTKEDEDLDVEEAHRQYVDEVDETVGENFDIYLNAIERKATRDTAKKLKIEVNTLIKKNHID